MRDHLPDGRLDWSARAKHELSEYERKLVSAYVRAHETLDIDGLTALLLIVTAGLAGSAAATRDESHERRAACSIRRRLPRALLHHGS